MQWLLKKHFWLVHLAGLAVCAFLLATAVRPLLALWLSKQFEVNVDVAMPRLTKTEPVERDFSMATERNIFGAKREKIVVADIDEVGEGRQGRWENATPTSLRIRLIGTAVFEDPQYSLATIQDLGKGPDSLPQTYSLAECDTSIERDPLLKEMLDLGGPAAIAPCNRLMGSAVIIRIEMDRVYFYNESEHRYEYLALEGDQSRPAPIASLEPSGEIPSLGDLTKGVRATGPNSYEIKQNALDEALANLSALSTQARVVPAFENGKPIGFRMFAIMPDSVFSKIGFKNGDVLTRINGYEVNSPDKALELYNKLKTATQFSVDIKRGGKPQSMDYSVAP